MPASKHDPSESGGEKESSKLNETVHDAWMSVLGVYQNAEHEVHRATSRLLEAFGTATGESANLGAEIISRVRKNREELERKVDEGVRAAVARARSPIDEEIALLKSRIEKLQTKLDERKRAGASGKKKA